MARKPLRPLIRSGGFYPSRKWTPLVYAGGYTTANGGEEPAPPPIEKTITGNPIHILDALAKPAQALSIALEPVQDLNGYSYPWPAGGGKNVLPTPTEAQTVNGVTATPNADGSITLTGTASAIAYFDLITGFDSTAYAGYIVTGLPDGMASNSSTICYRISTDSSRASLQDIQRGASGAYVGNTIVDNGTNLVFSLRVNNGYALPNGGLTLYPMMRASSASEDFAPYSNICPISGWTVANVTRTGKNLLNSNTITQNKIIDNTGAIVTNNAIEITDYIRVKPSTQYVLSGTSLNGNSSNADVRVNFYTADKTWKYRSGTNKTNGLIFTTDADTYFVRFSFSKDSTDQMCEEGSTATPFVAYNGSTYSITFPSEAGTVYGGTLDVTTGVLTVNWAKIVLNGTQQISRKNWKPQEKSVGWIYPYDLTRNIVGTGAVLQNIKCDTLPSMPFNSLQSINGPGIALASNQTYGISVMYPNTTLTTESAINAFLAEHPIDVVYELAEPVTYQLTPTEVTLLLGENSIWSDGEMTLTYLADGNASDEEALNILLGGRYVNNHSEDEPTDREALNIVLGGNER